MTWIRGPQSPGGPQTGASLWPVDDGAVQQEVRGVCSLHRAIADCGCCSPPAVWPCPCVLTQPMMSSYQQGKGQEELQIGMERLSHPTPCPVDRMTLSVGRGSWERTHGLITASALLKVNDVKGNKLCVSGGEGRDEICSF